MFFPPLFLYSCSHISTILGNKFDHGAEAIVPVLFNLIPNCAKVMATSGVSAIRIIIRVRFTGGHVCSFKSAFVLTLLSPFCPPLSQHTHVPRLIPLITSNCTSKSVAVRR